MAMIGKLALAAALMMAASLAWADEQPAYVGVFGGVGALSDTRMQQQGTVITPFPFPDINVNAKGDADATVAPIAGLQFGYGLWHSAAPSGWAATLDGEVEGLYLSAEPKGVLDIDPQALGTQYVSLPLTTAAALVNAVIEVQTPYSETLIPYAGLGAGYGMVFVNGSNSTNPSEPGINHFNSEPDASAGGLALQAKIGLRAHLTGHWSAFTEYRHVYVAPVGLGFGETDYPGEHLPTTRWKVDLGAQNYNLWVAGLSYRF